MGDEQERDTLPPREVGWHGGTAPIDDAWFSMRRC